MKIVFKQLLLILTLFVAPTSLLGWCSSSMRPDVWYREHIHNQEGEITVFAHGLGGDLEHGTVYANCDVVLPSVKQTEILADGNEQIKYKNNFVVFNFPDVPLKSMGNKNTGIAQKSEMKRMDKAIDCVRNHGRKLVLYGVSRGASTIANVVGRVAKENRKCDDIKALVLESPFAHCRDCVEHFLKQQRIIWGSSTYDLNCVVSPATAAWCAKWIYEEYCENCNKPMDWAHYIPTDMPILLVCCTQDDIVPASSTKKLYKSLKDSGHTNVYLFEAEHGTHANILNGDSAYDYAYVLNAFYKKYSISHNEDFAQEGEELLAQCQPELSQ